MKHETLNSILGAIGLALAAFTAWHQFAPSADNIEIVNEGRVSLGRDLEYRPIQLGNLFGDAPMVAAGPVSWRMRIYNPSDRPVSLVAYEVYLLAKNGSRLQYSGMNDLFSPFDPSLPEQKLPEVLEPRTAKAYLISVSMPFRRDESQDGRCEEIERQLQRLEMCLFAKGRDLFGNPVTVTRYDSDPDGAFSVSWNDGNQSAIFEVVFETADGSTFSTSISYFPDL